MIRTRYLAPVFFVSQSMCCSLAAAQAIDWALPVDGFWSDVANWSPGNVPDNAIEDARFGLAGPYHVRSVENLVLGNLSVMNPDVTVTFDPPVSSSLFGSIVNHGEIVLISTTSNSNSMDFLFASTLSGTGTIRLASETNPSEIALKSIAQLLTNEAGHSIVGSGLVDGMIQNNGEIIADSLSGSDMALGGSVSQAKSARIGAIDSTLILRQGTSINGGELFTSGTGEIIALDSVVLQNIVNNGMIEVYGLDRQVQISESMTNNGSIHINSNAGTAGAELFIRDDVTLNGSGGIRIQEGPPSLNMNGIMIDQDATLTIGNEQTIEGSGEVVIESGSRLVNNGVLVGTDPKNELIVEGRVEGNGRFAAMGGQLELHGSIPDGGQYFADDGVLRLVSVRDDAPGMISGLFLGTSESGVIDLGGDGDHELNIHDLWNTGNMSLTERTHRLQFSGSMQNDGLITIGGLDSFFSPTMIFKGEVALVGTGEIYLAGQPADGQMNVDDGSTLTIGPDQKILGNGSMNGTIINNGEIRTGIVSGEITNNALIQSGMLNGVVVNNGTIDSEQVNAEVENNGVMMASAGRVSTLFRSYTGEGIYRVEDGGAMRLYPQSMVGQYFESEGSGYIEVHTAPWELIDPVSDALFVVLGHQSMGFNGEFVNNKRVSLRTQSISGIARLRVSEDSTISGNGTIELGGDTADDSIVSADSETLLTIGGGQSIFGNGQLINVRIFGELRPAGEKRVVKARNLTLESSSTLMIDIDGHHNDEFGRLIGLGTGEIELGGTLVVRVDDGIFVTLGHSWIIIASENIQGRFDAYDFPETNPLLAYRVIREEEFHRLVLTCKGDLTGDFSVDFFDVSLFIELYGIGDANADFNGDGVIDFFDISSYLESYSLFCP